MSMRSLVPMPVIAFVSMLCLTAVPGCVGPEVTPDVPHDAWTGEMTGMITGKMDLKIWRGPGEGDVQSVQSDLNLNIEKVAGGFGAGTLQGKLAGKIKDGLLKAGFTGFAMVAAGDATVRGSFIGTVSETQGFGTWEMKADPYRFNGEWTMEKR